MRACYCPKCGASLKFEEDNRDYGFCQYCGTKIMLDDYRSTHRVVDEARIREAEINEKIRLKELEMEEKKLQKSEKNKIFKVKASIILGIVGVMMMVIGIGLGNLSGDKDSAFYILTMLGMFPLLAIAYMWIPEDKNNKK